MAAETWVSDSGGVKRLLTNPVIGTASGNKPVQTIWVGTATGNKVVYVRSTPVVLTVATASYSQINTSWTGGTAPFTLKRGSTTIYSGANRSFNDTGLTPGTSYSYTLTDTYGSTQTKSATTTALPGFAANAGANDWNTITVSWSNLGAGWTYAVAGYTNPGTATSWIHDGLAASTGYSYTVYAYWNGVHYLTDGASASTPARPTSTGYAKTGYTHISSGGWTQSTQCNPGGGNLAFPVGGTMTSIVIAAWGYSGSNARVEPWVGGVARMHTIVGPVNVGGTNVFGLENIGFAASNISVGMRTGGTAPGISDFGRCEWDTWSPYSNYKTQVYVDGINYWYYAGREAVEEMRVHPWWRDDLAEPVERGNLHIETTADQDGNFLTATIIDIDSGELLVNWEAEDGED